MNRFPLLAAAAAIAACAACSNDAVAPSPAAATITFDGAGQSRAPVALFSQAGFTVSVNRASWIAWTDFGSPRPCIVFQSANGGGNSVGEIAVFAAGHAPFRFRAIDLYSSVTPIPYVFTGYRDDTAAFTIDGRLPNTFGNFVTVANPRADALIDTLIVTLTNSSAIANPMGVDNIVLAP